MYNEITRHTNNYKMGDKRWSININALAVIDL